MRFTVIRGNISEVKTLASGAGTTKGVDADVADRVTEENLDGAVAFAKLLPQRPVPLWPLPVPLTSWPMGQKLLHPQRPPDDERHHRHGLPALCPDGGLYHRQPQPAAGGCGCAVCAMGLAGEIAHARLTPLDGNVTYRNYIIDAIYHMTPAQLEEGAKYEVR